MDSALSTGHRVWGRYTTNHNVIKIKKNVKTFFIEVPEMLGRKIKEMFYIIKNG